MSYEEMRNDVHNSFNATMSLVIHLQIEREPMMLFDNAFKDQKKLILEFIDRIEELEKDFPVKE